MVAMGAFDGANGGRNYKTLPVKKQKIITSVRPSSKPDRAKPSSHSTYPSPAPSSLVNGKPKTTNGHARSLSRSLTPSQPSSKEKSHAVKSVRSSNLKRSSPAVSTPRFDESDSEDEEQDLRAAKRPKLISNGSEDSTRRIKNLQFFPGQEQEDFPMIHAVDIANYGTEGFSDSKYSNFFTATDEDDEEDPTVELQYPGSTQRERYHLVKSSDNQDYLPVDEIIDVVKAVAQHYLDSTQATALDDEDNFGLVQKMEQARSRGLKGKPGAQRAFVSAVEEYNTKITALRNDGSIEKRLDEIRAVDFSLVETIFNQTYTRTVSPHAHLTRKYENGTSEVYGELLPRFMSTIFKETHLKSDQVFVDLGSGVGNCVIQAALQIGCESWGWENMKNPCDLADQQKVEFEARCRLWGLQPGAVQLERASFLDNEKTSEVLKRADVVLVNNRAFQADLMDNLKYIFLDLKEGCQIVSLKPFREPGQKIQDRHDSDPIYTLQVVQKEYPTKSVSWMGDSGDWYLSTKDSRELKAFRRRRC